MKFRVRTIQEHDLAYTLLPFKRNQDVIRVHELDDGRYVLAVVDGWNWKKKLSEDEEGRKAALFVASEYPSTFLKYLLHDNYQKAAQRAADDIDTRLLHRWPKYVSAVASFLFHFVDHDVIVFVGKGIILVHNGRTWEKPEEIGDYFLDELKFGFPNEVSRFFGRGELKGNPLYSCNPDVVIRPSGMPVFLASDGLEDVFTLEEITQFIRLDHGVSPRELIDRLLIEVTRRGTQRDDISILVRL